MTHAAQYQWFDRARVKRKRVVREQRSDLIAIEHGQHAIEAGRSRQSIGVGSLTITSAAA